MAVEEKFVQSREGGLSLIKPSEPFLKEVLQYSFRNIIDFGCGFGCHVAEFAKAGRDAYGVDVSFLPEAKEEAKKGGYQLIEGSWENIPEKSFDAGFSHHCLEHALNPVEWLHAWGRIIKPGGKLFVVVPTYREEVLAGHVSNGWNCHQLAYLLAVAGYDCRDGRFSVHDGSVFGIVDRPEEMTVADTHVFGFGRVASRMPRTMTIDARGVRYLGDPPPVFAAN